MADTKYFIIYKDKLRAIIPILSLEERGELLTAINAYQNNEQYEPISQRVQAAMVLFIAQFEEDAKKYDDIVASKQRAACARWHKETQVDEALPEGSPPKPKARAFVPDYSFIGDDEREAIFMEWIEYKKGRRESYKTQKSLEQCYKQLQNYGGNNTELMRQVVQISMANNWSGLFPPKNNSNNGYATQYERQKLSNQQLADALFRQSAEQIELELRGETQGGFVPKPLFPSE